MLTDFRLSVAPRGKPEQSVPVTFASATADFSNGDTPISGAIDTNPQTGWRASGEPGRTHCAIFTTDQDVGFPEGTVLTFSLDQRTPPQQSLGRFRLLATNIPRPVPVERPGKLLPTNWVGKALAIFEDHAEFATEISAGGGQATLETGDKFSGTAAFKIVGYRENVKMPRLGVKIRENPAPGEYRFYAVRSGKKLGRPVDHVCQNRPRRCMGTRRQSQFSATMRAPDPSVGVPRLRSTRSCSTSWTVVTRDLFQDFGEFTFTGPDSGDKVDAANMGLVRPDIVGDAPPRLATCSRVPPEYKVPLNSRVDTEIECGPGQMVGVRSS